MPVVSNGTITVNGIPISTGPFRTQREVLNAFGIYKVNSRGGSYAFPGRIMIWFPNCVGRHDALWHNTFTAPDCIVETVNPDNDHAMAIGVGMMMDDFVRITFAKQGNPAMYYYAGVFQCEQPATYGHNTYHKIMDSFSIQSVIEQV